MHMQLSRVVAGMATVGLLGGLATATPATSSEVPDDGPPNVVMIMTDDMRADELEYMPHTRELLGQLELSRFVSNHPLCCPARAELLTGQFGHTSGVVHNGGAHGGYQALDEPENTLPAWFDGAGYTTSMVGKFVNGWTGRDDYSNAPVGWDHFDALTGASYHPYNYGVYTGPDTEREHPGIHTNDFVAARTVQRITESAGSSPFFVWSSYIAPHHMRVDGSWQGPTPAERHRGLFAGEVPTFESKPSWERVRTPSGSPRRLWRERLRSLQSVDEGVRDTVETLRATGELESTVIVFTSDNGFLLGEHALTGKNLPYEEVLRVPLLATGPGVDSGTSAKGAMMVDIAPSLLALAGVEAGRPQEGRSDLFALDGGWAQMLIQGGLESARANPWWWRGVRERKWVYTRWADRAPTLYNLRRDPYQLNNLATKRPAVEKRLRTSLPEVRSMRKTRSTRINTARAAEPWG